MNTIKELENMARSYGLEFSNKGNGHIQLSNHGFMVNYWPDIWRAEAYELQQRALNMECPAAYQDAV